MSDTKENNIIINDSIYLPSFKLSVNDIVNKSIVIYGSRGSGKSIICKDIMYRLRNEIPCAIVFNSSESSNGCFSAHVSKPFLYEKIELKVLEDIWRRQESITEIHKKVNDVEVLTKIILKLKLDNIIDMIIKTDKKKEQIADKLQSKIESETIFLTEMNKLNDKFNDVKLLLLKGVIKRIKKKIKDGLINKDSLSKEELDIVKFIDINPNILLIFDDCAAELKKFNKTDMLRKMFYRSRHVNISFIITAQDEIDLDASLRKNSNITILCDGNCCNGFFERNSNSFGKKLKHLSKEISEIIYSGDYKNTKLIYNKDGVDKLMWYTANIHNNFIFGSKHTLEFSKKIIKDKEHDISIIVKKI